MEKIEDEQFAVKESADKKISDSADATKSCRKKRQVISGSSSNESGDSSMTKDLRVQIAKSSEETTKMKEKREKKEKREHRKKKDKKETEDEQTNSELKQVLDEKINKVTRNTEEYKNEVEEEKGGEEEEISERKEEEKNEAKKTITGERIAFDDMMNMLTSLDIKSPRIKDVTPRMFDPSDSDDEYDQSEDSDDEEEKAKELSELQNLMENSFGEKGVAFPKQCDHVESDEHQQIEIDDRPPPPHVDDNAEVKEAEKEKVNVPTIDVNAILQAINDYEMSARKKNSISSFLHKVKKTTQLITSEDKLRGTSSPPIIRREDSPSSPNTARRSNSTSGGNNNNNNNGEEKGLHLSENAIISEKARERELIIKEIYTTEKAYVEDLAIIIQWW